MTQEEFIFELKELGIELTKKKKKQLKKYYEMLVEYNQHMNLTGITEESDVYLKHFYDSLTLEKAIHLEKMHTLCDIGTGAKNRREQYDVVTSRAVANLSLLSEISLPLVRVGGYFIPMKAHLELEMDTLNSIIGKLNGKIEELISFDLPNEHSVRNLLKIKKIEKTHYKYPRKFADMKKKPLQ